MFFFTTKDFILQEDSISTFILNVLIYKVLKYSYIKREKESTHLAIKLYRNVIFYPSIV